MWELQHKLQQALQTVYDPDFPLVDIYTLWLIYTIDINEENKKILITMSFTTPVCPMADYLLESVKTAALIVAWDYEIDVETTFDPMRTPEMIRDEDLKRMFN